MGLCHASAPYRGQRQFCGAPGRAGGLAAGPPCAEASGDGSPSPRNPIRDADTAPRRPFRDDQTAWSGVRLSPVRSNRAAVWLLLLGVRFYQAILAPLMFSVCKFYPSCSHYAAEAIERHGARRGLRLAAERLWRCRPFTPGGYDPVPEVLEAEREEDSIQEARA